MPMNDYSPWYKSAPFRFLARAAIFQYNQNKRLFMMT
jgi:hypothetical protein